MNFRAAVIVNYAREAEFESSNSMSGENEVVLVVASDASDVVEELKNLLVKTVRTFAERRRKELNRGMCYTWLYGENGNDDD